MESAAGFLKIFKFGFSVPEDPLSVFSKTRFPDLSQKAVSAVFLMFSVVLLIFSVALPILSVVLLIFSVVLSIFPVVLPALSAALKSYNAPYYDP